MTQLIGAICENREKVILLADRMVSTFDMSLAFEYDEPKGKVVSHNAMVLTAGTTHEPELIEDTKKEIKEKENIRTIAENLSKQYRQIREKRITHDVLSRSGISSFAEFHRLQNMLNPKIVDDLDDRIYRYDLGLRLLLGGVDETAHLYMISDPGSFRSFDAIAFCCIGSGDRHAAPVFALFGFSPKMKAEIVLQISFEAKKKAEMAGGVGKKTDIWIIDKEGIKVVSDETIAELEEAHEKQEDLTKYFKSIEIKTENLI